MVPYKRRPVLKVLNRAAKGSAVGTASARLGEKPKKGTVRRMEETILRRVTGPTDRTSTDLYRTDDREDEAGEILGFIGEAPMARGIGYPDKRDFAAVRDMVTGPYVFRFTPDASQKQGGGHGR